MNPHFANALAQAKDEYERLEIIHKEDLEIIDRYSKRIDAANLAIQIGLELVMAAQDNEKLRNRKITGYTTEQMFTLLMGIKDKLNPTYEAKTTTGDKE